MNLCTYFFFKLFDLNEIQPYTKVVIEMIHTGVW